MSKLVNVKIQFIYTVNIASKGIIYYEIMPKFKIVLNKVNISEILEPILLTC